MFLFQIHTYLKCMNITFNMLFIMMFIPKSRSCIIDQVNYKKATNVFATAIRQHVVNNVHVARFDVSNWKLPHFTKTIGKSLLPGVQVVN